MKVDKINRKNTVFSRVKAEINQSLAHMEPVVINEPLLSKQWLFLFIRPHERRVSFVLEDFPCNILQKTSSKLGFNSSKFFCI